MAAVQLNPVGLLSTDEGYVSSISIRSAGGTVVYTPDANNAIGIATGLSAQAATRLVGGQGVCAGSQGQGIKLING